MSFVLFCAFGATSLSVINVTFAAISGPSTRVISWGEKLIGAIHGGPWLISGAEGGGNTGNPPSAHAKPVALQLSPGVPAQHHSTQNKQKKQHDVRN